MNSPSTRKHDPSTWRYASAVYNGKAFGFRTQSGAGNSGIDDRGATHFLSPDVSDAELGAALRDTLEQTRLILDHVEFRAFFSNDELKRNKQSWIDAQVANMYAKSYAILRKQLALVGVHVTNEMLYLQPSNNLYGRKWIRVPDHEVKDICILYASDDAVIGTALREAFRRCDVLGTKMSFEGWPDDPKLDYLPPPKLTFEMPTP